MSLNDKMLTSEKKELDGSIKRYSPSGRRIRHYWSCQNPDHHHMEKRFALACIKKSINPIPSKLEIKRDMSSRNDEITKKYADGVRVKEIASIYGLSAYRIYQILNKRLRCNAQIHPQYVLYADLRNLDLSEITLDNSF